MHVNPICIASRAPRLGPEAFTSFTVRSFNNASAVCIKHGTYQKYFPKQFVNDSCNIESRYNEIYKRCVYSDSKDLSARTLESKVNQNVSITYECRVVYIANRVC